MRNSFVSVLIAAAALLIACEEEEVVGGCDPCPFVKTFQPLTEREHVLNNLELSYNERRANEFGKLLDNDFTFFFSPGDVGGNIPDQWGRVDELAVASRLFDLRLDDPNYPTCSSIRVDLMFESGVQWLDIPSPDVVGETWSTTTVYYQGTFEMKPDMTYIMLPDARAQFAVRNVGTDVAPQWRLVEWRDLADDSAVLSAASTEKSTWGQIKALYRGVD